MLITLNEGKTNRITIFSKFNYALRSGYTDNYNYIPDPVIGSEHNTYVYFQSNEPGVATVNWGDGNVETFDFINRKNSNIYICSWRTLAIDYVKNPASVGGGWGFGVDGEDNYIIPYENHHYEDDNINTNRKITINFSNTITTVNVRVCRMNEFPIIEMNNLDNLTLNNTYNIPEIPINRISKLKNLTTLSLTNLGTKLEYLPDTLFDMTKLTTLSLGNVANLSNIDASNIRKIVKLKNLINCSLSSCSLPQYLKEFNELPNIRSLSIGSNIFNTPQFDEINQNLSSFDEINQNLSSFDEINQNLSSFDEINQNLSSFDWYSNFNGGTSAIVNWGEQISGKGVGNITSLNLSSTTNLVLSPIPTYIKNEMRSLSSLNLRSSLNTQAKIDTFITSFYNYIMTWGLLTMTNTATDGLRNQFYQLNVVTYTSASPNTAVRPSGIYQAPSGFIEGISNGTPSTPMEHIYVLEKNYKQKWTIKPE